MDDYDEHDTIVMQDEDEAEVKEEDEQELIILPFMGTCSKQIRGFSNKNGCMVIPVSKAKDSKVMCDLCCDILKSNASLERHRKIKHSNVLFTCEECGTQKDSFKKLWNHQQCHKTLKCRKCYKQILYANTGRHAKLCKGKKSSQKCDKCEYSTTSTSKME